MSNQPVWFLLYDGSSCDGYGSPDYVGRTTDPKEAEKFYKANINNPYSLARVDIIDDDNIQRASKRVDWSCFERNEHND